ncbi:Uncharacterised protein r2_g811 [Pycnogonum litorale]
MASKKRKYIDSYIEHGFISMIVNGEEKPQCVLCNKVLGNDSMRPTKLKQHLEKVHPQHKDKDRSFFERHGKALKAMKLDKTGSFRKGNDQAVEASYSVALEIAKQKKPHTIGENLIKPCALKMAEIVLGKECANKLATISLSNNTVQRRITDMAHDIKAQVVNEIKSSAFEQFSIQLDESTDVASCSQLMVFARYIHSGRFKEEFLFCVPLETTTKATDVLEKVSTFFEAENIRWESVCGCCTDGAPAMLGAKSGFQTLVKRLSPGVSGIHCMIHRQALASKTLPNALATVLDETVQIVNFIKGGGLNSRLFKKLCGDMDADHQVLLFHTNVRWLSKGNVTRRVFELREELKLFCEHRGKMEYFSRLNDEEWIMRLAYLADIFEQLNLLNLQMQGHNTNMVKFLDSLNAFLSKAVNWRRKIEMRNVTMFEKLDSVLESRSDQQSILPLSVKEEIIEHLTALQSEFRRYFPELGEHDLDLIRNPFGFSVEKLPDACQDEFIELQNDSGAKDLWNDKLITEFWPLMMESYPNVAKIAIKVLMPFVSTYLCESAFSTLLHIKTKQRNKLEVQNDLRCALSTTPPRIKLLMENSQSHPSH